MEWIRTPAEVYAHCVEPFRGKAPHWGIVFRKGYKAAKRAHYRNEPHKAAKYYGAINFTPIEWKLKHENYPGIDNFIKTTLQAEYNYMLPYFKYDDECKEHMLSTLKECVVCTDKSRFDLLVCGHAVCPFCYSNWAAMNIYTVPCPYCRNTEQESIPVMHSNATSYADAVKK